MKQYNKGCSFNQIYSIVAAMGGNAIPGVTRASPAVYEALKLQVHEAMRKHFSKVTTPKEFPEKRDYGDVDIVYAPLHPNITAEFILVEFGEDAAKRAVTNGPLTSFPLNNIQIDLIGVPEDKFEVTVGYYSYGDVGRAIGSVARWYGLKWSQNGLFIPINYKDPSREVITWPRNLRDNGPIPGDDWLSPLLLSVNVQQVMEYFGYDFEAFKLGLSTELDVWTWLAASPFFDIDIFQGEIDRNLDSRKREFSCTRPAYSRFLAWLDLHRSDVHCHVSLPDPLLYFEKEEVARDNVRQHTRNLTRKQKYSGHVLAKAGIERKRINDCKHWLEGYFIETVEIMAADEPSRKITMEEWIDNTEVEAIENWVREAIEVWKTMVL